MANDNTPHQLPLFPAFDNQPMRTCTGCDIAFPATSEYFYERMGKLHSRCKDCVKKESQERREKNPDYNRDYYWANRERELERSREWKENNPEHVLEKARQWREDNPDYRHEYYLKNKERTLQQTREYVKKNPHIAKKAAKTYRAKHYSRILARERKYRDENPEKVKEANRKWRIKNNEYNQDRVKRFHAANPYKRQEYNNNYHALKVDADGTFAAEDIERMIKEQGERCYYCTEKAMLTVDHKTPLTRGGSNYPDNLCMACQSCNSSKSDKTEDEYYEHLLATIVLNS